MSGWMIYWIMILDNAHSLFGDLAIALGIITVVLLFTGFAIWVEPSEEKRKRLGAKIAKWSIITAPFFVVFATLSVFTPTTKQMAIIYVVPKMATPENTDKFLNKIPSKLLKLSEEWLEDLSPKKEE